MFREKSSIEMYKDLKSYHACHFPKEIKIYLWPRLIYTNADSVYNENNYKQHVSPLFKYIKKHNSYKYRCIIIFQLIILADWQVICYKLLHATIFVKRN